MSLIQITPYNPNWPNEYQTIAKQLRSLLDKIALRIDHIGSTSIDALAAKDVIDIQISVDDVSNTAIEQKLTSVGFVFRDEAICDNLVGLDADSIELKKKFFQQAVGQRRVHIHVRQIGRINQEYPLLFRDYLRSDVHTKRAYAQIKIELAKHFSNDANAYYAIKDPYMDTVYAAAKLWAKQTNWQQDTDFN
ncbi:GrpB family protein [Marinicellulosiphila megalodicopiae]|uniref:GrpB family protein n=1 Tax=Marinicellulosiphila megalodicopiae TaxID=2724896 RepID=UPI003BAF1F4D